MDDILPFFLSHAIEMFPHLDCMDDLKKISDLRLPANWYKTFTLPLVIIFLRTKETDIKILPEDLAKSVQYATDP